MDTKTENVSPGNTCEVGNLQVQYFPNSAKDQLDAMAMRNKMSRRELFVLFAQNAEEIEKFLKNKKVLVPRP